ncbi:MAG: hypothetical protein IJ575_09900 [Selenomonadaceae bacterium]|nr:hypothetical protein [Selenomonadaceae bacterium]
MKFPNMNYVVKFNNRVGNTYAIHLEDAMHDAKSLVNYKLAQMAIVFKIQDDGQLLPITYVA